MQVKRAFQAAVVCGSLLGLTFAGISCNKDDQHANRTEGGGGGATAVVNIDKVAQDLGWLNKMEANLETYRTKLADQVKKYNAGYEADVRNFAGGMIPPGAEKNGKVTLDARQSQELSNYIAAARQQAQQVNQGAVELFNRYKMSWVREYREALSPIVRQVAEERHMNVVLQQADNVLYADRSVDLTDGVVDAARGKMPTLTEVPMTDLEAAAHIPVNPGSLSPTTQGATTRP